MKKSFNFRGTTINFVGLKAEIEAMEQKLHCLNAISAYMRTITGVKGNEHSSDAWVIFGGNYPLRDKEGFEIKIKTFTDKLVSASPITPDFFKSITQEIRDIYNVHVHVVDNSVTPEEDQANNIKRNQAAQEREVKAQALESLINLKGEGTASRGLEKDTKSFLTIEACFNDSHSMTDYFNPSAGLSDTYACAVIPRGARREDIARSIVNASPELQQYTWEWENGSHVCLKSSIIGTAPHKAYDGRTEVHYWYEIQFWNSGHEMQKSRFFIDSLHQSIPSAKTASSSDSCTIRLNEEKGGIEIRFTSKPDTSVLDKIKSHGGWRWSKFSKCWYCRYSDTQLQFANTFTASPVSAPDNDNIGALVEANENAGIDNWAAANL